MDELNLDCPVCNKVMEFGKKFIISIEESDKKEFIKLVSESRDSFIKFINFADTFTRKSEAFKMFGRIHVWGLNSNKKYSEIYYDIANGNNEGIINSERSFDPDPYLKGEL